jgi:hypothetical protein
LDFQLNSHDEYLKLVQKTFKTSDIDGDGYLNAEQMKRCFHSFRELKMNSAAQSSSKANVSTPPRNENATTKLISPNTPPRRPAGLRSQPITVEKYKIDEKEEEMFFNLLNIADPNESNKITFSAVASAFSRLDAVDIARSVNKK